MQRLSMTAKYGAKRKGERADKENGENGKEEKGKSG